MDYIFKRKLYQKMLDWKTNKNGSTAILIEGPRRVGKSTLAKTFAQNEYDAHLIVDFATAPQEVVDLFKDISNLDYLLMMLQFVYNVVLPPHKSVIIFDEVQMQPLARQAIKYLVADGRFHYIETGSLVSIKKNVNGIVIPSEETRMSLQPLDFEEFRWALNDTATVPLLRQAFESRIPLGDAVTRKILRDFRLYMLVGGMPQALEEYIKTNNLSLVDGVKREIIDLYVSDFRKIDPTGRMGKLFKAIPGQLAKNAARYQVSSVDSSVRADDVLTLIADLEDSKTVNIAYHANDPNVGLSGHINMKRFKLFTADTGLFITLSFMDRDFTENDIYAKLLSDKLPADLGYLYENVVAQTFVASGYNLFYHTFQNESSNHNYEVDFILPHGHKIRPVEVKSSGYKTHKSFDVFCEKFSSRISDRYIIYTKDLRKEGDLVFLPVFMAQFL